MSNNGDVEYDGDSWFFSYEDTRKISEIGRDSSVTLTFTALPSLLGKPGIFIAATGEARLGRDKTQFEAHWMKIWIAGVPMGSTRLGLCSSRRPQKRSITGTARTIAA